jgi:hypothetical protein
VGDYGCRRAAAELDPTDQKDLARVFHDHYQSSGLLVDGFEAATANPLRKAS